MEGFRGRKFFARDPKRSHAALRVERGAEQKNFLFLFRRIFLVARANPETQRKFFCEAGRRIRRLAAASVSQKFLLK